MYGKLKTGLATGGLGRGEGATATKESYEMGLEIRTDEDLLW